MGSPATVRQGFARARSKGGFFARHIRNHYAYRRLDPDGEDRAGVSPYRQSGDPVSPPPAGAAH